MDNESRFRSIELPEELKQPLQLAQEVKRLPWYVRPDKPVYTVVYPQSIPMLIICLAGLLNQGLLMPIAIFVQWLIAIGQMIMEDRALGRSVVEQEGLPSITIRNVLHDPHQPALEVLAEVVELWNGKPDAKGSMSCTGGFVDVANQIAAGDCSPEDEALLKELPICLSHIRYEVEDLKSSLDRFELGTRRAPSLADNKRVVRLQFYRKHLREIRDLLQPIKDRMLHEAVEQGGLLQLKRRAKNGTVD